MLAKAQKIVTAAESVLERAGQWYLQSGIQSAGGGVARYYLTNEQRALPISTEITGYAASALAYLYRVTEDRAYLDAARRAARFLVDEAWNEELETFPFECSAGSPSYFFDCGIIIRGLLAVYRLTGDKELLSVASKCGRSMSRDFLTGKAIHPVVSMPDRRPVAYEKRWSREPGCFQLKSALAWRDLAQIKDDSLYTGYWEQALVHCKKRWETFLPGVDDRLKVMDRLHAHCYFLEALLAVPDRSDCAETLRKGIDRTGEWLREIAPQFARSDVYAQLLRVRIYADALDIVPLDMEAALEEARAIPLFQYETDDVCTDGGFCFGTRDGGLLPYANPVSTAFCLQALEMWRQRAEGTFQPVLEDLI